MLVHGPALFGGIYKRGAGLGPASAFLYSGPAINVLAIVLTARILGFEMGVARAVGAITFSVVIGLLMHLFFRADEQARVLAAESAPTPAPGRPLGRDTLYFASMTGILVFGAGCAKCRMLTDRTEQVAKALGLDYTLEKVTDIDAIVAFGVLATSALVVDGEIKVAGRIPTVVALEELLA